MPFPDQDAGLGLLQPFRKITLDVDGVEFPAPSSAVFEWQQMANGKPRLLIATTFGAPNIFQELVRCLATPVLLLYILHTPRGEGVAGRYQSPLLNVEQVEDFLVTFKSYLAGDARHDIWVHSPSDARTLIWDRHDLIYAEGEPLEDMTAVLEAKAYQSGRVPRSDTGAHIHYYRDVFDEDAAAVLAHFDWTRSNLRPEDEQ